MVPWAQHSSPHPKWHLDWFSRFCTAHGRESLYFTTGRHFSSSKLPLHMQGSGPHLIHGALGPPRQHPEWHHDQFSRFCRAHGRETQTDRQCYSVHNNRPRLASAVMWPKNEMGRRKASMQYNSYSMTYMGHVIRYRMVSK